MYTPGRIYRPVFQPPCGGNGFRNAADTARPVLITIHTYCPHILPIPPAPCRLLPTILQHMESINFYGYPSTAALPPPPPPPTSPPTTFRARYPSNDRRLPVSIPPHSPLLSSNRRSPPSPSFTLPFLLAFSHLSLSALDRVLSFAFPPLLPLLLPFVFTFLKRRGGSV